MVWIKISLIARYYWKVQFSYVQICLLSIWHPFPNPACLPQPVLQWYGRRELVWEESSKKQIFSVQCKRQKLTQLNFFEKSWNLRSESCVTEKTSFIFLLSEMRPSLKWQWFLLYLLSTTGIFWDCNTAQATINDLVQHTCKGWLTQELRQTCDDVESTS